MKSLKCFCHNFTRGAWGMGMGMGMGAAGAQHARLLGSLYKRQLQKIVRPLDVVIVALLFCRVYK